MAGALAAGDAGAGDPRQQQPMQQPAAGEQAGPASKAPAIGAASGPEDRERAEPAHNIKTEIHAQHQEVALGKVDDAHDPEDQPEADAHQAVDGADQQPGDERLNKILDADGEAHRPPPRQTGRTRAWRLRPALSFTAPCGIEIVERDDARLVCRRRRR